MKTNFVEGSIERNARSRFVSNDQQLSVDLSNWPEIPAGSVTLGIRPENISLSNHGNASSTRSIGTVTLDVIEPMGNEIVLYASYASGSLIARIPPQKIPDVGSQVILEMDPEKLHFFDSSRGERISA